MLKNFKKIVSLILALTLSLMVCVPAFAAESKADIAYSFSIEAKERI